MVRPPVVPGGRGVFPGTGGSKVPGLGESPPPNAYVLVESASGPSVVGGITKAWPTPG